MDDVLANKGRAATVAALEKAVSKTDDSCWSFLCANLKRDLLPAAAIEAGMEAVQLSAMAYEYKTPGAGHLDISRDSGSCPVAQVLAPQRRSRAARDYISKRAAECGLCKKIQSHII